MPEFDVIIRGGTVVDGTRAPRQVADVGIKDGKVAKIGKINPSDASKSLDASGLFVAPGFVDLHTHYDAQINCDPYCTLSGWHGVTSIVVGNCGFGFAPCKPELRDRAMLSMSRVEAIPFESMKAGMKWDWVTFPDWLDFLDRTPKGLNVLSNVPLAPIMIWVMGLEAAKSRPATLSERKEMQRLLNEAMDAGGCGFSCQRLGNGFVSVQRDYDGTPMVTDTMAEEDLLGAPSAKGGGRLVTIEAAQVLRQQRRSDPAQPISAMTTGAVLFEDGGRIDGRGCGDRICAPRQRTARAGQTP